MDFRFMTEQNVDKVPLNFYHLEFVVMTLKIFHFTSAPLYKSMQKMTIVVTTVTLTGVL